MAGFWKRYRAVLVSRGFVIAAAAGFLILLSAILSVARAGYWVHSSIALAAVAVGGGPILLGALKGLVRRQVNVDELVTVAIVASVIYGEYLSAAFVAFMMLFGKVLEDFTAERARTALESLGALVPPTATVRRDGQDAAVPVSAIVRGDVVVVRPGERIAVDGVVLSGQASVNQSPITGESMPVAKSKGSGVYAGTVNEMGALVIEATRVGEDTTLDQVKRLIEEAERNQAPIVRTADRYARFFTPAILIVAALVYVVTRKLSSSLAVLIVACPCALVLATPIAVIAGVANGARRGILIKGGARLEAAGRVTALAIDKTGTITLGEPQVVRVVAFDGVSDREVLERASMAERLSEHPLGEAVMAKAREWSLAVAEADAFDAIPGQGVVARLGDREVVVGTEALMREREVAPHGSLVATLCELERDGLAPLVVASDGKVIGAIGVADAVREEMKRAIHDLRNAGVHRIVMLTGDSAEVARRVASSVGIEEWQARLLPQQKVESIQKMQSEGYKVAMLGDGINDAPALAQSDVGVAMGVTGTDIAMDTADIVLMTDDALKATDAINLSRRTLRTIKQNLLFALVFNLIGIVAAASGVLVPIAAALFHNFGSVGVVVNSARLAGKRKLT